MFKSLRYKKKYIVDENGAKKCACGHGSNFHDYGICYYKTCHCVNAVYFYHWVKRNAA